jgi:acetyltransferase
MSSFGLERIFAPRRVAIVGGSRRPSSIGALVLKNIKDGGFAGEIAVVNPEYGTIGGVNTFPDLRSLSSIPDLIVVTAPASTIPEIIKEAGTRGVAGAVIISSGLGHGAGSIAEAVERTARACKMRIVGPNCLGVMFPGVALNASFAARHPTPGSLALISQSGAIAAAMVDWGAERSVGYSGIVSIGDQLDVDVADLLDYFALDDKTSAILLYVEAITDARKFMSAARAAARLKPVVVVKSGRMAQGAKAAATHTGALAGSDAVYDAAFRRAGFLRVLDLRELFDCAELLGRHVPPPQGRKLAILTNGGGLGIMAVDRLAELGGTAPALMSETSAKLDSALPPTWPKANPVDISGDADPKRYLAALDVLLADPAINAVLVMNVETAVSSAHCRSRGRLREKKSREEAFLAQARACRVGWYRSGRCVDLRQCRNSTFPDRGRRSTCLHAPRQASRGDRSVDGNPAERVVAVRARREGGAENRGRCAEGRTSVARSRRDRRPVQGLLDSDGPDAGSHEPRRSCDEGGRVFGERPGRGG